MEKKIGDVDPDTSGLVTTTVLNIKISEVENKISGNSKYITTQVNSAKFCSMAKKKLL